MKKTILFLSLLSILLSAFSVLAQPPYTETYSRKYYDSEYPQKMPVLFRGYPVYTGDGIYRVYLPLEIQYRFMQFVRNGAEFKAGGEIEIAFRGRNSEQIARKINTINVISQDYQETLSPDKFFTFLDSVDLPPDRYNILVKYTDANGSQRISFTRSLILKDVTDFYSPLPLLLHPGESADIPLLSIDNKPSAMMGNWDFDRDLGVYITSWQRAASEPLRVDAQVLNSRTAETILHIDTTITGTGATRSLQFMVPREKLQEGRHRLQVLLYAGQDSIRKSLPFNVIWFQKPRSLWSLKLATDPLEYIVEKETLKSLQRGSTEERWDRLHDFWKEKDPTPETPFNELATEFYSRVDSTLTQFSSKRTAGWRTDRGKVYITQGVPDRIEDHSLDPVASPFLRWIYVLADREVVFTFESLEGRKKYRLLEATERPL